MDSPKAILTKEGEISIITLNDGKANVFSPAMIKDVNSCLDSVSTDSGCLIIRGSKGMFSAGFDLKVIGSGDVDAIKSMSKSGFEMLSRILDFPRPVIGACTGHGIALGTFLLCCCDYRIGLKGDFMIGANEMRTNMVIPIPILELIKFRVSQAHKYRAILGGTIYPISEAVEAGLIDEVVDEESFEEKLSKKAQDLATMGHPSYSLTKELFIGEVSKKIKNALEEATIETN
ncbi:MAG: crotonase/enoyl-CoA hydratase family protein [Gammaproteobacteria bacterium]